MPRTCTICRHPQHEAVDKALVAGEPFRNIALRFGTSSTALYRHKGEHLPELVAHGQRRAQAHAAALQTQVRQQEAQEQTHASSLFDQVCQRQAKVERLASIAEGLISKAANKSDWRGATAAVQASVSASREVRGCLELLGKLMGELDERPQINVLMGSEWLTVRGTVIDALAPWPEARTAVSMRLLALGSSNGHASY